MQNKIIVGTGRQAVETYYRMHEIGIVNSLLGFTSENVKEGDHLFSKPVFSFADVLNIKKHNKVELLIAIGDVKVNKRLSIYFDKEGFTFFNMVDNEILSQPSIDIGTGVLIAKNCALTCHIRIGNHVIINIGCNISHDCQIGNNVNISPGCNLAGNVTIGDQVFVGIGASFIPKVTIGNGCVIAAGSCVTKSFPDNCMVAGVPAVIKKYLN